MRFTATPSGFVAAIGLDKIGHWIAGYLVTMTRGEVVRTYWYRGAGAARHAAKRFEKTGRWPRKKNVRNVLHRTPSRDIMLNTKEVV